MNDTTPTTTHTITGHDAIRLAERDGLTLRCYGNPIEPEGGIVTPQVGRMIAREDAGLLYVTVRHHGDWWLGDRFGAYPGDVGEWFNSINGEYLGPDDGGIEPRWNDA